MIRIALYWAHFCARVSFPILESTNVPLPHVEAKWPMSLQQYLNDTQGSFQIQYPGVPNKMRDHDEYIMDIAMNMSKLKPGHLRRINYCRMYLNVTTISDITNATGDIIDAAAFEGRREYTQAKNTWNRVHQHKPDKNSWSLWKNVLRQVSYKQYLIQPLGQWIIPTVNI
jgi:hypothetical protein